MTEFIELKAKPRDVVGKANRRLAAEKAIPAVLYGYGVEPTNLAVDRHTFEYLMQHEAVTSTVIRVAVEGGDGFVNAIVKDIQEHPVDGHVLHVDLMAIDMSKRISTSVPLHLVGESVGVKEGGILTQTLTEVEVEALPADLPDYIEADISELGVGDSLHVSELVAPEGVDILSDPESIVVSITTPKIEEVEEEVVEEGEVPEVGEEEAAEAGAEAEGAEESSEE